ncbi:MerR family transcriptional regulator [Streptomyces sp. RB6PN25]|uniref:MerR family transcriptional regulator n=1 Tax=Streptomyces humicola TaxID=2953240 RepID=A0ABT1Q1H9_9ACTN|nr:MerR family transcriptional regulator [Streptomyces humicola]MCQ4083140.1 MerR family transcriptional regulator [Streptomyces humicola]
MDDDGHPLLTIGQLSRRTGLAVRTIRYWSDIGAVPPAGRTTGGYRLYDAASVARLELVRTLRELGLGLDEVRRVLQQEITVADVAAAHVAALDAQIRSLRLSRAVLSTVAKRHPGTEEMALMNKLARLSAQERRKIIEEFVTEVFSGLDADPQLRQKLMTTPPELPDEPTPEQVDAWVELAELVSDPGFRQRMRRMAEYNAESRAQSGPARDTGAYMRFPKKVSMLVGEARERGVAPDSAEAAEVVDQLLAGADAARRAYVLERLEAGIDSQSERYHRLLAVINGQEPRPSHVPDFEWLIAAIRARQG